MEPVMKRTTLEEIDAGLHVFDADYPLGQQVLDSLDHVCSTTSSRARRVCTVSLLLALGLRVYIA